MDYKFEIEEAYIIDWKKTDDIDVLSIGMVVHQDKYYVTIASYWQFPGMAMDYVQVIRKKHITKVYHLGFADESDRLGRIDEDDMSFANNKSRHGC